MAAERHYHIIHLSHSMRKTAFIIVFICFYYHLQSQISVKPDIGFVNQNIWRGVYQSGISIQPKVNGNYKNWNFEVWATSDIKYREREVDMCIGYNLKNFNIGITDYWLTDLTDAFLKKLILENNITYTFSNIPLNIEFNTVLTGISGHNPVYQRISYSPEWHGYECDFSAGFSPWNNYLCGSKGFAINELQIAAGKEICLIRNLTINFCLSSIYNIYDNSWFFVCGLEIPFFFRKEK